MSAVLYNKNSNYAEIILNRPDRLNAINAALLSELSEALETAERSADIRLVVLKGEGRSFSTGDDLVEFANANPTDQMKEEFIDNLQDVTRRIMFGDTTVVCAVHGWVVGGAAAWPLNADFSIWSDNTKFYLPEAGYGMFVSGGVSVLLSELCGSQRASEIMMCGQKLSIEDLSRDRLAPKIVPSSQFAEAIDDFVASLLSLPSASLRRYKAARVSKIREDIEKALLIEKSILLNLSDGEVILERLPELARG